VKSGDIFLHRRRLLSSRRLFHTVYPAPAARHLRRFHAHVFHQLTAIAFDLNAIAANFLAVVPVFFPFVILAKLGIQRKAHTRLMRISIAPPSSSPYRQNEVTIVRLSDDEF
jgi:hypothetical protein